MLSFLPAPIIGILSLGVTLFTIFVPGLISALLSFIKMVLPFPAWRVFWTKPLVRWLDFHWVYLHEWSYALLRPLRINVNLPSGLTKDQSYLVICNHQSWVDTFILQTVFVRHIQFLRFFAKQELLWIPVCNIVWLGLDFPFMKRYSRSYLLKHPEMRGKDFETTRKSCERFRGIPVSLANFIEGTRLTPEKHQKQGSIYKHLLNPKSGGFSFALNALRGHVNKILDVTIHYPNGAPGMWDWWSGKCREVTVKVRLFEVPPEMYGDYQNDLTYRSRFKEWLGGIWREKDQLLEQLNRR